MATKKVKKKYKNANKRAKNTKNKEYEGPMPGTSDLQKEIDKLLYVMNVPPMTMAVTEPESAKPKPWWKFW
jgi:hypothetical protein